MRLTRDISGCWRNRSPDRTLLSPTYKIILQCLYHIYDITVYASEDLVNGYPGFGICYLTSFNTKLTSVAPGTTAARKRRAGRPELTCN